MTKREQGAIDHPMIYTKEGHVDLSWLLTVVGCVVMVACIFLQGFGVFGFKLPDAGWACLGAFVSLCFISGASREKAAILAKATLPGAVAAGIASVRPLYQTVHDPDER